MNLEQARDDIVAMFQHVLREVDPERLVCASLRCDGDDLVVNDVRHEIAPTGRVVLLGVGKSAIAMARGAESVLGGRLDHGLVVTKSGITGASSGLLRTEVIEASHPVPDEASVHAGIRLMGAATDLTVNDLAIVLVSGGGSSLVEAPVDGISLDDFKNATTVLLKGGADIWTLNSVRRRLSRIKAGGLARAIAPARVVNLILSDVLGNPLGVIASGLSVDSGDDDGWRIESVKSSPAWSELPSAVRERLEGSLELDHRGSSNVVQTIVLGDATLAARAAVDAASQAGYRPFLISADFAGDAREFGRFWAQMARSVSRGSSSITLPACVIGAGEMTVTVRGNGKGGRNTEMAASAALEIDGHRDIAIASLATDGDDGSSQAAGGVVDGETIARLRDRHLDPHDLLARNDTRTFLDASGGLIVTGQTGTNVNDLYFALVGDPGRGSG